MDATVPGSIPCCFAGKRIIKMPAYSYYTSSFITLLYQLLHFFKRNTVKINRLINFKMSQFPSIHCRIVAGYVFNIAPVFFIFPVYTIGKIILVTKHETFVQ